MLSAILFDCSKEPKKKDNAHQKMWKNLLRIAAITIKIKVNKIQQKCEWRINITMTSELLLKAQRNK